MRLSAYIFSIIFHPLLILSYMLVILQFLNPYEFASIQNDVLLMMVFLTTCVLPVIAVALMKQLDMVSSFMLDKRQDRIGPFIISAILYLSLYLHLIRSGSFPHYLEICTFGVLLALFLAFFINNFVKVSLHAVGMGGLLAFGIFAVESFSYASVVRGDVPLVGSIEMNPVLLLYIIIVAAGLVCTSRLILKSHVPRDIYGGFIIGFFSEFLAFTIMS